MSMNTAQNFAAQYELVNDWLTGIVNGFEEDDWKLSLAPGKNHALWLLGHLVASDDDIVLYLGKGDVLYPHYQEIFSQGKPLLAYEKCPPASELKESLKKVFERNSKIVAELREEEFDEPHALVENYETDYFKTKRRVVMAWQLHQLYHTGQLGAILSMAGKKIYG